MTTRAACIKDIAGALFFMAVGAVFLHQLGDVPENAAKYPSVIICVIFTLCVVLMIQSVQGLKGCRAAPEPECQRPDPGAGVTQPEPEKERVRFGLPTAMVLVVSFLYVLALPYIGFTMASAVAMVTLMLVMGVRSVWMLVLVPVCEIGFLLYVFEKLLTVFLPNADALRGWLGMG